jgi:retron-type reverse transcriptase
MNHVWRVSNQKAWGERTCLRRFSRVRTSHEGYRVVVDVDLEKFFDLVNHDILMDRLAKRIADKAVLRLIRRYLQAGIMANVLLGSAS